MARSRKLSSSTGTASSPPKRARTEQEEAPIGTEPKPHPDATSSSPGGPLRVEYVGMQTTGPAFTVWDSSIEDLNGSWTMALMPNREYKDERSGNRPYKLCFSNTKHPAVEMEVEARDANSMGDPYKFDSEVWNARVYKLSEDDRMLPLDSPKAQVGQLALFQSTALFFDIQTLEYFNAELSADGFRKLTDLLTALFADQTSFPEHSFHRTGLKFRVHGYTLTEEQEKVRDREDQLRSARADLDDLEELWRLSHKGLLHVTEDAEDAGATTPFKPSPTLRYYDSTIGLLLFQAERGLEVETDRAVTILRDLYSDTEETRRVYPQVGGHALTDDDDEMRRLCALNDIDILKNLWKLYVTDRLQVAGSDGTKQSLNPNAQVLEEQPHLDFWRSLRSLTSCIGLPLFEAGEAMDNGDNDRAHEILTEVGYPS